MAIAPPDSDDHDAAAAVSESARDDGDDDRGERPGSDVMADALDRAMAAWDAACALLLALRGFGRSLLGLLRSELQLARATIPWIFALGILLIGLALSLWLSSIALIGWGFYVWTGSVGWALLALMLVHAVLIVATVFACKRLGRSLTLPSTRAEVRGVLARARGKRVDPVSPSS